MNEKKKMTQLVQKITDLKKDQICILLLVGILLMVISIPTQKRKSTDIGNERTIETTETQNEEKVYVKELEQQLEGILSQMEGVGNVSVMITLQSSAEQIVEKDIREERDELEETDSQGGNRDTRNIVREEETIYEEEDSQSPYIKKALMPRVEGVLVVADGGSHPVVVKNITEVIQALFGIESHKIKIVKRN